jgi:hypothetical protein
LQVGDKLYAQLPGAAGVTASPVLAIEDVIEHSAFNLQTLRGAGCATSARHDAVHSDMQQWQKMPCAGLGEVQGTVSCTACMKHPDSCAAPAGNFVVQDIATAQYGTSPHLPTWAAKDIERLKLAADAKMRTAYRLFPAVVRQLHTWRLLTPAYKAVGALGVQVSRWVLRVVRLAYRCCVGGTYCCVVAADVLSLWCD